GRMRRFARGAAMADNSVWFAPTFVAFGAADDQRRVAPHCMVVNLVRSGRKQPQLLSASAGGTARHPHRLQSRSDSRIPPSLQGRGGGGDGVTPGKRNTD